MSFDPLKVDEFIAIFKNSRQAIASFEGCHGVRLLKWNESSNVYFTHSIWENENALNKYRESELFLQTWTATKALFNDKPQAWTLNDTGL